MALMRKDGEGARRIDGEGVYLREPELRDYQEWADLRDASRAHLTPWEPTWAQDETSRGSYRYKLRRYAEDARDDKAYALFYFREEDEALVGGVTLSNIRRGVAQMASLGYWAGEKFAKGLHDRRRPRCGAARLRRFGSASRRSRVPAGQPRFTPRAGKSRLHPRRRRARLPEDQRRVARSLAVRDCEIQRAERSSKSEKLPSSRGSRSENPGPRGSVSPPCGPWVPDWTRVRDDGCFIVFDLV